MPRTLKRRSDAISRDDSDSNTNEPPRRQTQTQRRRQESTPPSSAAAGSDDENNSSASDSPAANTQTHLHNLTKKLVRLALSSEYARQPLRRTDVNAKIMKDAASAGNKVQFRTVFNEAQKTLRDVFGMELVDLPSRERTGINERRKAISQKVAAATQRETQRETQRDTQRAKDPIASAASWILISCLPAAYKVHPDLFVPSRAPDEATESTYIALYTLIVSVIYLHTPSAGSDQLDENGQQEDSMEPISEAKLLRHLSRLQLGDWAPINGPGGGEMTTEKLLARMLKEGYLEKRKDSSGGEEVVEWVVGPRGKKEIGRKGVASLVRGVYGFGIDGRGKGLELPGQDDEDEDMSGREDRDRDEEDIVRRRPVKMERDELERRLKRTLGDVVTLRIDERDRTNGVAEQIGEEE